jgi:hypothetical protein
MDTTTEAVSMTDVIVRPKRRRRVVVEPHESVTFYLPVEPLERLRRYAEARRMSYSEAMSEAMRIFLASRIQDVDITSLPNGNPDAA